MSSLWLHLVFGLGGGLGAAARHALSQIFAHRVPFSTLIINVLGSFLLGLWAGILPPETAIGGVPLQRLAIGFCGGFTTFSSFAYQTLHLGREDTLMHAAANIVMNLVLCLVFYGAGLWLSGALIL